MDTQDVPALFRARILVLVPEPIEQIVVGIREIGHKLDRFRELLVDGHCVRFGCLKVIVCVQRKNQFINKMSEKTYLTHDNGGRAFVVDVYPPDEVIVGQIEYNANDRPTRGKKRIRIPYKKLFIGDKGLDAEYNKCCYRPEHKGNSFLIERRPGVYIHIGVEAFRFQTRGGERILKYYSPVGNSDVPYPYAIGEHYTYFLLEDDHATVPNHLLDLRQDAYHQFYDLGKRHPAKRKFRVTQMLKRAD